MTWPKELIATVRERADLVALAEARAGKLTGTGALRQGKCPLCGGSDTTNRFTVWPERGRWKCFSCHEGGDAIRLVQLCEHLSFPDAARVVARGAAVLLPEWKETDEGREYAAKVEAAEAHRQALLLAARHFSRNITHPTAQAYLQERGLDALAETAGLGYATGDGTLLQALEAAGVGQALRLGAGLTALKDGREFESYRNRLVIPLEDHRGRLCGFTARDIGGKAKAKYLNTPEVPFLFTKSKLLFGFSRVIDHVRKVGAVLVEGQLDALRVQHHGAAGVAPGGTSFTEAQAAALAKEAREVVLLFDGDAAGSAAIDKAGPLLLSKGAFVRVARLPEGEDPDSWLRAQANPTEALAELLKNAVEWVPDWAGRTATASAKEREELLGTLLRPALAGLGIAAAETYAGQVAKAWELSKAAVLGNPSSGGPGQPGERGEVEDELTELNLKHFVAPVGNKTAVATVRQDPHTHKRRVDLGTFDDFRNLYSHRKVEIPASKPGRAPKVEPLGRWWLDHPQRRQYEGVVFAPGKASPPGYFNLWSGWAVQPAPGDCSLYRQHIQNVICSGRKDLALWVWRWMAHATQKPWELPESGIVLRGLQGTGKGAFVDWFAHLFGPHAFTVYSNELLAGRFNGHMKDILLLHSNEASWGGDKVQEGQLKGIVTDKFIPIEHKGLDAIFLPNYRRVIVSTNHEFPIARDADDRRWLVLDVSPDFQQAPDYFSALHQQMENGGAEALLWDLQHEPLAGWTPRKVPATQQGWDIKLRTLSGVCQWWHECLKNGCHVQTAADAYTEKDDAEEWTKYPPVRALHRHYLRWCERMNRRSRESEEEMGRTLRKMYKPLSRYRPKEGGKRFYSYKLGELAECREAFEGFLHEGPYLWDEETPAVPDVMEEEVSGDDTLAPF